MSDKPHITIDDFTETFRPVVEVIGVELALKLIAVCPGDSFYVPMPGSIGRGPRDRDIVDNFDGCNYRELARKHKLSVNRVRQILRDAGQYTGRNSLAERDPRQLQLEGF